MALTLGLVLTRPRIRSGVRIGPGAAAGLGVMLLLVTGGIDWADVTSTIALLWRPLITIASIMVMTFATGRIGLFDRLASMALPAARGSGRRLFTLVFGVSVLTSAVLNNDAAVLLLVPLVVSLIERIYATSPKPIVPFAFAVFMAAGVAPLVISNPMNMIVAEYGGIGFNSYALRMLPIAVAGWIVTFFVLRRIFSRELIDPPPADDRPPEALERKHRQMLVLLGVVLISYPIASYLGAPVWIVAVAGAVLATALCTGTGSSRPATLLRTGISWETLGFLMGVFLLAIGLRNAGAVDWLADLYTGAHHSTTGTISALGSAGINNHPMALINLLSLEQAGANRDYIYAALIGGDLGPRLLPMGSLAGLLWLVLLRRHGIEIPLRRFVTVGAAVTVPSLAVSLVILELL
jgi:arsenical pump membrane protein